MAKAGGSGRSISVDGVVWELRDHEDPRHGLLRWYVVDAHGNRHAVRDVFDGELDGTNWRRVEPDARRVIAQLGTRPSGD